MTFNFAFYLSLVLASAGCAGLLLAGRGKWYGWAVGLAVQPVWALYAIVTEGYGLLITCLMYGFVYGRNLLKWRKDSNNRWLAEMRESPLKVIFAGSRQQADEWFRRNKAPKHVVATSRRVLEGLAFTRDDVVFVGNYYERDDFVEIMDLIESSTVKFGGFR